MKIRTVLATIGVAGAIAVGAAAAVPAFAGPPSDGGGPGTGPGYGHGMSTEAGAGTGPGVGSGVGPGRGPGFGPGSDRGQPGQMREQGGCLASDAAPSGTLTDEQRTTLAANAEEEKLAHDLYVAFADRYDAVIFDRIAASETNHLQAVRTLLARYGIEDPTDGLAQGQFATAAVQQTYDRLLAQGAAGERAALEVGKTVETTDIEGLQAAQNGLTAPDVQRLYTNLTRASQHHLEAFTNWLNR